MLLETKSFSFFLAISANTPGDTRSIWNEETGELFTYHWDTQKGVREKYNLSYGFVPSALKEDIQK